KKARMKHFNENDSVLVFERDKSSKLDSQWILAKVLEEVSPNYYLILYPDGGRKIRHADSLKRFVNREQMTGVLNNNLASLVKLVKPAILYVKVNVIAILEESV